MAEWLGSGLQNRVQQFESAWYLQMYLSEVLERQVFFRDLIILEPNGNP